MKKNVSIYVLLVVSMLCAGVFVVGEKVSAAMSSANYNVDSDVVGAFGGSSSSSNFSLDSNGGEVSTDVASSANFSASSGFLQNDALPLFISITTPADVTMGEITGSGQSALATNSATWNIKTNNPAGYALTWQASTAAMTNANSDSFAAYTPSAYSIPEPWSVLSSDAEWGAHVATTSTVVDTAVWGTGDDYATGKWLNVDDTAPFTIVTSASPTSSSGDNETIIFGGEIGSSKLQPTGLYTVDVTVTATTL